MSESGLSIGFAELKQEVGFFLGYGLAPAGDDLTEVERIIQSGVRRVYYPPAVAGGNPGHEWSWLRPTTTITLVADTGDYDLPDDLGRLVGSLHFAEDKYRRSITIIPVGALLDMRAINTYSSFPIFAAIRYKPTDGSSGQRQEMLFHPAPDQAFVLSYEYEAYNGALSDSYPYPLGGMQYAELYIESCLAVAESRLNDEIGNHTAQYQALLIDAIARDRKHSPRSYGQMGHVEDMHDGRRRYYGAAFSNYPIIIGGVPY